MDVKAKKNSRGKGEMTLSQMATPPPPTPRMTRFLLPSLRGTRGHSTYGVENCAEGAETNLAQSRKGGGGWHKALVVGNGR